MSEPRRFRIIFEDDGHEVEFCCAAWPSVEDRESALKGGQISPPPAAADAPEFDPEPRPQGRPSFDEVIGAAIESLGEALDSLDSHSARAREIRRYLARSGVDPDLIPKVRTIREYLGAGYVGGNPGGKSGEKPCHAKMARTGG